MIEVHRRPLELAAAAIDFELSDVERAELDRHIAGCSSCRRRIGALRHDATSIGSLPILAVSTEQSARLRAATVSRRIRSPWPAVRLVAVAAILALLALGAVAVGSALLEHDTLDLSVVEPAPSNDAPVPTTRTPQPSISATTPSPAVDAAGYQLPDPLCPDPAEGASPPVLEMDIADGEIVITPTQTSLLVTTCSNERPWNFTEPEPPDLAEAWPGMEIDVTISAGWKILHWEGYDRPRSGQGINVIQGETPPDGPETISVPVPGREGEVILGVTVWAQTTDGRAVASISTTAPLRIEPRVDGRPTPVVGSLTRVPANAACDSVGWPEDVPQYRSVILRMDAAESGYVTAVTETGAHPTVFWAGDGFRIGPDGQSVVDADGVVVARDGETLDVPSDGSLPDLGGYPVCVSPERLIVFLDG